MTTTFTKEEVQLLSLVDPSELDVLIPATGVSRKSRRPET